jgi:hypothetical protein
VFEFEGVLNLKVFVVQFFKFLPAGAPQIWAGPAAEDSKKRSDSDPVLLFWYFSGCPNSGIFLLFGFRGVQNFELHKTSSTSTAVLHL